jgi:hypothetical protein
VDVLGLEDRERFLTWLVGDTISDPGTDHHLDTFHVVAHHVLEIGHQGLLVYQVEVNLLIGTDLDPDVAANEVEEAPLVNLGVEFPFALPCLVILDDSEEADLGGGTRRQRLVVDEIHVTELHLRHLVHRILFWVVWLDDKGVTLPVEAVHLIVIVIVETLVRKVFLGEPQGHTHDFALKCAFFEIVEKVEMLTFVGVKQCYK